MPRVLVRGLGHVLCSGVQGSIPQVLICFFFVFAGFLAFFLVCYAGIHDVSEDYRAYVKSDRWADATACQKEITQLKQALKLFLDQPWYKGITFASLTPITAFI